MQLLSAVYLVVILWLVHVYVGLPKPGVERLYMDEISAWSMGTPHEQEPRGGVDPDYPLGPNQEP